MGLSRRARIGLAIGLGLVVVPVLAVAASDRLEFVLGGALIDLGYRLQDPIELPEHPTPAAVWSELEEHNALAASVRETFPRSVHHPLAAIVVCMDARIDTDELLGDTRRYYYVLRLAGSIMSEREEEMLELAVANGVEVIVLTTHTDCAAERVAADPTARQTYPAIAAGIDERAHRRAEFLARPDIARRIADGTLRVEQARIDTATGRLMPEAP
jgi:carbonic anhydrase